MRKESLERPAIVPREAWDDAGETARRCLVDLATRLGMNSSNSSLPPSSDRPDTQESDAAENTSTGRGKKDKKKTGGQPGHPKHDRPLIPTDECDEVQSVRPDRCERCGSSLDDVHPQADPSRHQVMDLPEITPSVIEYQRERLKCPCCGHTTLAKLPAGVPPGRFGPGVISAVTMLGGMCRLSQRLTVTVLENLFQLKLSTGMITKLREIGRAALEPAHHEIATAVRTSEVLHADETSWYEQNVKAWLWTAVAPFATLFLIRDSRSKAVARELIGDEFSGVVVTDRYVSYNWIDETLRQFCWAHLLRDFQAMIDVGGSAAEIGEILQVEGRRLIHKWKQWKSGAIKRSTFNGHARSVRKAVQSALIDGLTCDHEKTEGVCTELLKHFESLWTFTRVAGVEPTNNTGERAVRHGVIWRKLSQGTASSGGSRYVETILSVLATCRQNARNPFEFVRSAIDASLQKRQAPRILPKTA